ncbi:hypothetical protein [Falsiroseomonas sp. HW251]|uniref:hypothetical protein n=1 Tax=Falsiroseomonas sp. HW251 TaxID=3390998 RepID=UPI003D315C99
MRARLLLPALIGLLPATVLAQGQPPRPADRPAPPAAARPFGTGAQARLPPTVNGPINLVPNGQTPYRPRDAAPMPNRDIEAPRDRFANNLTPRFEPLILPQERRQGVTFGNEQPRGTPDRPFDNLVPGARLRIPFE